MTSEPTTQDLLSITQAAFWRLISSGMNVRAQDKDDILQAGYVGALEAARTWVPERGAFSTWITQRARGDMLNWLGDSARNGIGSRDSEPLTRYYEHQTLNEGEATIGACQTYDFIPKGFDPEVEAEAMLVQRNVAKLPPSERHFIEAAFGLRGPELSMAEIAERTDLTRMGVWKRINGTLARLGYRESAAPEGWAEYRETAFRKGAGATKASQPTGVLATKPYRRGRNGLYDGREARLTRVSNRRAWLAAARRANGLPR